MIHNHTMPIHSWLYALACVLIPVAWGLLMVWATDHLEPLLFHHHKHSPESPDKPAIKPLEYHI